MGVEIGVGVEEGDRNGREVICYAFKHLVAEIFIPAISKPWKTC